MEPVLQVALDHMHLKRALLAAKEAVEGGADWLEAGTPLVKSEGIEVVRQLKKSFPGKTIVADLKTMDTGAFEVEIAAKAGADVITVMGITDDATILEAVRAARLYKKCTDADVGDAFRKVSTPNLADAMQKRGVMTGLVPRIRHGTKLVGRALTVKTADGDWAKPVEAIDRAKPGDVIVIDVGGGPTAVWGELASNSCLVKGVAGVVIDGAVRDLDTILELNFPCFSRHVAPHAGEPKGLGVAKLDSHRDLRRGYPEVILCLGKTPQQIVEIAVRMSESHDLVLATRASRSIYQRLRKALDGKRVTYHERAAIVSMGTPPEGKRGPILVVTAGTSDIPVAEEAGVTAELMGCKVTRLYDVGVAGVHRVLDRRELLQKAKVIVVVAGMEGALPSVVAGLVDVPVIAVPTSVGYGASFDGMAALLGMMNACAPGVAVVNIDNGFGAGYLASIINRSH